MTPQESSVFSGGGARIRWVDPLLEEEISPRNPRNIRPGKIAFSCRTFLFPRLQETLFDSRREGFRYALANPVPVRRLPDVLVGKPKFARNISNYAAKCVCLSKFCSEFDKIHGGYQLSRIEKYAETFMNVKRKTSIRVLSGERMPVADAFRGARKQLKLTQDELAKRLKCSQDAISRWERGEDRIPTPALLYLASLTQGTDRDYWIEASGVPRIVLQEAFSQTEQTSTDSKDETSQWDPELMVFVMETVDEKLRSMGKSLPMSKFAELVVIFYELCRKTKERDPGIIDRLLKIA